jgi:hypothetical protein
LSDTSSITIAWDTKQKLKEKKLEFERELKKCLSWDDFFDFATIELNTINKNKEKKQ